jgi:multidrug efflux system membrane fusion protein
MYFLSFKEDTINENMLVVPASAVGENSEGRFVFLVEGEDVKAVVKSISSK